VCPSQSFDGVDRKRDSSDKLSQSLREKKEKKKQKKDISARREKKERRKELTSSKPILQST
jgi:hypothetical protein